MKHTSKTPPCSKSLEEILSEYDYDIPTHLIAQHPASPRDHARLLVYNKESGEISHDRFLHLSKYLPPKSVLVLNNTKVIPARLCVSKETGGKVELLYVFRKGTQLCFLSNKKLFLKEKLFVNKKNFFIVKMQNGKYWHCKPSFDPNKIIPFLEKYGKTPLPPYIKHSTLSSTESKKKYQSVFAKIAGSVAAPTASLHFTPRLLHALKTQGHSIVFVTLHVGLGTFAPLEDGNVRLGKLHEEWYSIDQKTDAILRTAKKNRRLIIAVGTTATRTLESAYGKRKKLEGTTDLFIREGYMFNFIDGLITNFHVPKSSLMMLVAALVGRKTLMRLYKTALRKEYMFFSFGDGMLII